MTTITDGGFPNIPNILARMAPGGEYRSMAEVLSKSLDIVDDVPFVECNLDLGHQIAYRTGLPSVQYRSLNQGVSNTKSTGAQFMESTGMMEDRAEVDVDLPGNIASWRRSEEIAKTEMMTQEFARALFYESAASNADRVHGLSARYGGTSGYTASSYVLTGTNGGVNCRSIWLISWAPGKVYGIYPKGSNIGLTKKDLGEIDCFDQDSRKFRGFATKLQWKFGFAVEDYRYTSRFQWDPDDADMVESAKGLYLKMKTMLSTVYKLDANSRFYMDRTSFDLLQGQLLSNSSDVLKYVALGGKLVPHYLGVPIRVTDALTAETAIS
jgi:hypothetical protein